MCFSGIKEIRFWKWAKFAHTFFIQKFQAVLVNKNETAKVNKPELFKL